MTGILYAASLCDRRCSRRQPSPQTPTPTRSLEVRSLAAHDIRPTSSPLPSRFPSSPSRLLSFHERGYWYLFVDVTGGSKGYLIRKDRLTTLPFPPINLYLISTSPKSIHIPKHHSHQKTKIMDSQGAKSVISEDMQNLTHGKEDLSNQIRGHKANISNPSMSRHFHITILI